MNVIKNDGKKEKFDIKKIQRTLNYAAEGVEDVDVTYILDEIKPQLFDNIKTSQIFQIMTIATAQNIQNDPEYNKMGARLVLRQLYKNILGKNCFKNLKGAHQKHFAKYIADAVDKKLIKSELKKKFNLNSIAKSIDPERDGLWKFSSITTIKDRYLLQDKEGKILETPQEFWMRIALGLSFKEKHPEKNAVEFYDNMSQLNYIPSTPTLFNSGASYSQLSSCFLMDIPDDIDGIAKSLSNSMKLVKYSGGIGASVTKLRSSGSVIKTIQGASAGPIPFIKMLDSVVGGINLGGRRRGALAVFMEPWHLDIERFLALKRSTGDVNQRAYFLNTSVFCNDEFLKRVDNDEEWYLFDPKDTPDLTDNYGKKFSELYNKYILKARKGEIKRFEAVKARRLMRFIVQSLIETSHPWITFKDPANARCPLKNLGIVHSSNLCTEIYLPTDEKQIAVCNLCSINLSQHIKDKDVDWDKLKDSVKTAIRQLDNVIDVTYCPCPEAEYANKLGRPVGLGVMGLSDFLEKIGLSYSSRKGVELFDRIMEFISYHAIEASSEIAREKGPFPRFKGSDWSKGKVPFDTMKDLENERGISIDVNKTAILDWDSLREKVKKGMRNGTVLAIAPTATISIISGTSQSIEPNFSNFFAKKNIGGKFIEINENLVKELKDLRLWNKVRENLIAKQGDLQEIREIPRELKVRFKTAYQIDSAVFIDYAARAQKWVDMSCSRNLYFATKDIDEIVKTYLYAWKSGLKSTYYAFFKTSMTLQPSYLYKEQHKVIKPVPSPKVEFCEFCQ